MNFFVTIEKVQKDLPVLSATNQDNHNILEQDQQGKHRINYGTYYSEMQQGVKHFVEYRSLQPYKHTIIRS